MSTDAVKKKRIAREIQKERVHLGYNNKKRKNVMGCLKLLPGDREERKRTESDRESKRDRERQRQAEREGENC